MAHKKPAENGPQKPYVPDEVKALRWLGVFVLLSLLVIDAGVWVSFRWVEEDEIHQQLVSTAQLIEHGDIRLSAATSVGDTTRPAVVGLPNDVIAIQRIQVPALTKDDFRESELLGRRYVVYDAPKDFILAKSDEATDEELIKLAVILGVVFFAQCLMLAGWWAYLRGRVRALFDV